MAEQADDVKLPAGADTAATESSTEENNTSTDNSEEEELVFDLEELGGSADETDSQGEPQKDAPEKANSDATSKSPESEEKSNHAERRKQQLNNEIRDKVAERNALRREIEELNRQKYNLQASADLPTVEALMEQVNPETGDYYTRTEAKLARIEAERKLEQQQRQLNEYTERVVDGRLRLKDEAERAVKDFPMFDEQSDSYNEQLAKRADGIAEGLIIRDNDGEVIGSRGSIYGVYATIAEAAKAAKVDGEIAGRKAALKMADSADVGSSSKAPASKDEDEFDKAFVSALLG